MGKKDWDDRWGDKANEFPGSRRMRSMGSFKPVNYKILRCFKGSNQCLIINARLLSAIKTRILIGLDRFELSGFTSYPLSMTKGSPVRHGEIEHSVYFVAEYKGRGKWLIIVG